MVTPEERPASRAPPPGQGHGPRKLAGHVGRPSSQRSDVAWEPARTSLRALSTGRVSSAPTALSHKVPKEQSTTGATWEGMRKARPRWPVTTETPEDGDGPGRTSMSPIAKVLGLCTHPCTQEASSSCSLEVTLDGHLRAQPGLVSPWRCQEVTVLRPGQS